MQKLVFLELLQLTLAVPFDAFTCSAPSGKLCNTFRDDFNALDSSIWKPETSLYGSSDWEFQAYTSNPKNVFVENGILYLKPTLTTETLGITEDHLTGKVNYSWDLGSDCTRMERTAEQGCDPSNAQTSGCVFPCGRSSKDGILPPVMSAMISTKNSVSMKYGKLEVRAKLPKGDWIWPAIWLLPKTETYGIWPRSGEIDLMESRGNQPSDAVPGFNQFGSTLHWGNDFREDVKTFPSTHADSQPISDDFHTYGLRWTPDAIITYLDDPLNIVMSVPMTKFASQFTSLAGVSNLWSNQCPNAPFDQEFYLIFNVAVGGVSGYFPDSMPNKPWKNSDSEVYKEFWNGRASWYSTWDSTGYNDALAIDWVQLDSFC